MIEVILGMKRLGHRAYTQVNERAVLRNAARLPEDGIPTELVTLLPNDHGYDKLRMQKAATPVEGMQPTLDEAAARFAQDRPNAVVLERSSAEESDVKVRQASALKTLVDMLDSRVDAVEHGMDSAEKAPDSGTHSWAPLAYWAVRNSVLLCCRTMWNMYST